MISMSRSSAVPINFPIFAESQDEENKAKQLAQRLGCAYAGLLDASPKSTRGRAPAAMAVEKKGPGQDRGGCSAAMTAEKKDPGRDRGDYSAALVVGKSSLWLEGEGTRMKGDFLTLLPRIRVASLRSELLIKASGINKMEKGGRKPRAIDATAGMGEDSFLLAAAGFTVIMCEKDPIVAALLQDALDRAMEDDRLREIASRMILMEGDSIAFMKELQRTKDMTGTHKSGDGPQNSQEKCTSGVEPQDFQEKCTSGVEPQGFQKKYESGSGSHNIESERESGGGPVDVILLDPMFPQRTKSALVKKKFQLIHLLEKPCEDEEMLLQAAMQACPGRILIKRPAKGPWLADQKPAFSLAGKAVRYDCLLPPYPVKPV